MKQRLFLALAFLLAVGCMHAQEKTYAFKSGIMKAKTTVMGMEVPAETYWDDFGLKGAGKANQGGAEIRTLVKDNVQYMILEGTGKGVKQTLPSKPINYLNLTDEMIDQYQMIQLDEKQTILGHECIGYNMIMDVQDQKVNATVWVFGGIAMKMEQEVNGEKITMEATSLELDVPVDEKLFEIPEDIEWVEMQ